MVFEGKALTVDLIGGGLAELKFDLQDESVNRFNTLTLSELSEAVETLRDDSSSIKGLIVTSGKDTFIAGADITEFKTWFEQPEAQLFEQFLVTHNTFATLEDLPFPTITAINGFAIGGGFEVTLATDYRVMSTKAKVGLPEVKLGIFPGWGGTIRLPRLIGLNNAIEWICTGAEKQPEGALSQGAVDAVMEPEVLRKAALDLAEQCIDGKLDYKTRRREKRDPIQVSETERTKVFENWRAFVAEKARSHYPAPMIALECIEKNAILPRDEASKVEAQAFAKVARSEVASNLIGLLLNDQALKKTVKDYMKYAAKIESSAVLGAGIMGGGIACQAALKGIPIVMKDVKQEALDTGLNQAKKLLSKQVERGRIKRDEMGDVLYRIKPTLCYDNIKDVDFVIEAIIENEQFKKTVLKDIEGVVSEKAIIASNTSTISITGLAMSLQNPQRFCGMHFFNPVHAMPLVEVIRGERTSEQTVATTVNLAESIGKNPVVVNDCPGFLVNRILFPYLNAFVALIRDGADFQSVDKVMERFGWPMGPGYLIDVIGIDTVYHANEVLAKGYPDRMKHDYPSALEVLNEHDRLGQKTGSGFYKYKTDEKGKPRKFVDEEIYELIKPIQSDSSEFNDEEIIQRMMVPMCLEAARCIEDRIVESPATVDMGLIWGLGFPPFRGGPLRYIDSIGAEAFCTIADRYAHLGKAYHATEGLRENASRGKTFF